MKYTEIKKNIFENSKKEYYFAHCISEDCKMGAGIAVDFKKHFHLQSLILENPKIGEAKLKNRVFNLITKKKYYGKPTYDSLQLTLNDMKKQIIELNIDKIVMPKIGCGLDKLQWGKVREMVNETFKDIDNLEILICYI